MLDPSNQVFFGLGSKGGTLVSKDNITSVSIQLLSDQDNTVIEDKLIDLDPEKIEEKKMPEEETKTVIEPEVLPPETEEEKKENANLPVLPGSYQSFREKINTIGQETRSFLNQIVEKKIATRDLAQLALKRTNQEYDTLEQYVKENLGK